MVLLWLALLWLALLRLALLRLALLRLALLWLALLRLALLRLARGRVLCRGRPGNFTLELLLEITHFVQRAAQTSRLVSEDVLGRVFDASL